MMAIKFEVSNILLLALLVFLAKKEAIPGYPIQEGSKSRNS